MTRALLFLDQLRLRVGGQCLGCLYTLSFGSQEAGSFTGVDSADIQNGSNIFKDGISKFTTKNLKRKYPSLKRKVSAHAKPFLHQPC